MFRKSLLKMAHTVTRGNYSSDAAFAAADPGVQKLLSQRFSVVPDLLSPVQLHHLKVTLAPFLPAGAGGASGGLSEAIQARGIVPAGHHLVFFNDAVSETELDPDGYDGIRSPRGRWSRRMWAGGSVTLRPEVVPQLEVGRKAYCYEVVESVEIKPGPPGGDGSRDKMFVWFKRRLWAGAMFGGNGGEGAASAVTSSRPETDERGNEECPVVERRCLVYMPERAKDEPAAAPRVIKPPHAPLFSHTFTPSPTLLFRYSALTFNAHKIHVDPSFAKGVESHPNLIVQGPLMLTFLLELLRTNVLEGRSGEKLALHSFEYKNLAPLYVDQPCRICGRLITLSSGNDDGAQAYELWAETLQGGYAVKGTAIVKPIATMTPPKL